MQKGGYAFVLLKHILWSLSLSPTFTTYLWSDGAGKSFPYLLLL